MKTFKEHIKKISKEDKATEISRIGKILSDNYGYDAPFVLNANGGISLSKQFNMIGHEIFDRKIDLPCSINSAKDVYIKNMNITSEDMLKLPKIYQSLKMIACDYSEFESFELATIIKGECYIVAPFNLDTFVVGSRISDIRFTQCDDVKMIDVSRMGSDGRLEILDNIVHGTFTGKPKSQNIFTYDNIKFPPKLYKVSLDLNVSHFTNGFSVANLAYISTRDKLSSFRNIDNYSSDMAFTLDDDYTINSIITTLLIKSPLTTVSSNRPEKDNINDILRDYLDKDLSERKEFIMDCAVELIDAGYPEAAEL